MLERIIQETTAYEGIKCVFAYEGGKLELIPRCGGEGFTALFGCREVNGIKEWRGERVRVTQNRLELVPSCGDRIFTAYIDEPYFDLIPPIACKLAVKASLVL